MSRRCAPRVMLVACVVLVATQATAQDAAPAGHRPNGDPDIQGLFTFRTLTPLQRPVNDAGATALLANRETLTEEEAAELRCPGARN